MRTINDDMNDEERAVWQMAYSSVLPYLGPEGEVHTSIRAATGMDEFTPSFIHPLSKELIVELFETVPNHLHWALAHGWTAGLRALKPC